jgi:hypothetical protein
MRKTVVATLALFISLMVLSPAQAVQVQPRQHHGTVCKSIYGNQYPFPQLAQACITTNTRDIQLGNVQALGFVDWETNGSTEVRWDWMHLYRNGNVVEQSGDSGWGPAVTHLGVWADYNTDWNNQIPTGAEFRSVHRIRFRTNFQISDWYKFDSNVWTCNAYCD